jgi:hypothetical protein
MIPHGEDWKVEFNIGKGRDIGTKNRTDLEVNPIAYTIKPFHHSF